MSLENEILNTLKKLIAVPSISGTSGEKIIGKIIYEMLEDMPYFKENRDNLGMIKIEKDTLDRGFVWALVEGNQDSNDTFILTGHFDVVDVEEYGHLSNAAFDVDECTKRISELKLDKDTEADLKSGEWIFGRGTADIKSGIASYIEIVRELSTDRNFKGNLLLLLVPGEESNSEGMVASLPFLVELQEKGYNFVGAIVSECSIPKNEKEDFKKIYLGSVGKVMPMFFCAGKETHVGEPFKGINPNAMASEINRLLELNPSFCDKAYGRISPAPTVLKQMDLKKLYSVKTPLYSVAYYNMLTLNRSEQRLQTELKNIALEAFENVLVNIKERAERFGTLSGEHIKYEAAEPCVMTYGELLDEVKSVYPDFDDFIKTKIYIWKEEGNDNQTIAINIVRETYEICENKRPVIIISFIPPFYPHVHLGNGEKHLKFLDVIEKTICFAKENYNENIEKDHFFMGISDLSYTGSETKNHFEGIVSDIVGYGISYDIHLEALNKLNIPGVVFGGEGKDIHKYTERLHLDYSLRVVPELYKHVIYSILKI